MYCYNIFVAVLKNRQPYFSSFWFIPVHYTRYDKLINSASFNRVSMEFLSSFIKEILDDYGLYYGTVRVPYCIQKFFFSSS